MRGEIFIDKLPTKMINNLVLVSVEDTFEGFTSKGGIGLVNLTTHDSWGDSKEYNISEFVMRSGTVLLAPKIVTKGSFSYATEIEIETGDVVFWSLISFQGHIPLVCDGKKYLLVDYHELIARKRGEDLVPINGFALLSPVEETKSALAFSITSMVSTDWTITKMPEKLPVYPSQGRTPSSIWEPGDKVKILVGMSPFELEGTTRRILDKKHYACPVSFIICTVS